MSFVAARLCDPPHEMPGINSYKKIFPFFKKWRYLLSPSSLQQYLSFKWKVASIKY
jgi:hypothetical protein